MPRYGHAVTYSQEETVGENTEISPQWLVNSLTVSVIVVIFHNDINSDANSLWPCKLVTAITTSKDKWASYCTVS